MATAYQEIQEEARKLKISISELCERVGCHRQTLQKWKQEEPRSIEIYRKIMAELKAERDSRKF